MSDSKGFWGAVAATPLPVARKSILYSATPPLQHPSKSDETILLDAYKSVINYTRTSYLSTPTKTGRPTKGPRYLCVTRCTEEGELGLSGSHIVKAKRWSCKTCGALCVPVWADGPLPDQEEIEQTWADAHAKKGKKK